MSREQFTVHTSTLFDPTRKRWLEDTSIIVNGSTGCIVDVYQRQETLEAIEAHDVDLRGKFVLPGFVDAHAHIFLHSYAEKGNTIQKTSESMVERIIRGVNHCRTALLSGFTTYRDLGSEAMQDADTNVRDAVNRGLIPGPRLFVATRPLAGTGGYEVHTENELGGSCCPRVADAFDGPHEARRAVRSRIAAGADVIKFYADYRRRVMRWPPVQQHPYIGGMKFSVPEPNPDIPILDQDEMQTIVREAYLARAPVACHAKTWEGIKMAIEAGVLSIEHGNWIDEDLLQLMKAKGCIFVPTLAISERLAPQHIEKFKANVKRAHEIGVRLAVGGDTGTFPHGQGIREAEIMIESGIPLEEVLEACSIGGWESCGGYLSGVRFGWFEPGLRADVIALEADPRLDYRAMRRVDFVMKDGQIWKQDGQAVNMIDHHHRWDQE